jgi:hypothetical protein
LVGPPLGIDDAPDDEEDEVDPPADPQPKHPLPDCELWQHSPELAVIGPTA